MLLKDLHNFFNLAQKCILTSITTSNAYCINNLMFYILYVKKTFNMENESVQKDSCSTKKHF